MATALAATPQPGTVSAPASVLLAVTGAPSPPTTAYASSFAAGVDSWAVGVGFSPTLGNDTTRTPASLRLRSTAGASGAVSTTRAVSGLTVGAAYRLRVYAQTLTGQVQLSVREAGGTAVATGVWVAMPARGIVELAFTPTQTSMTLELFAKRLPADAPTARADLQTDTITVDPTGSWAGAVIRRTDANGTSVPVRNPNRLDTAGGVLTITDYEAAMTGTVAYTVTDGLGATASASCSQRPYTEVRRNRVANPRAATATTDYVGAYGTTGAGTLTQVATGGPRTDAPTFARATWTTAQTASTGAIAYGPATSSPTEITVTPGELYAATLYVRASIAGQTVRTQIEFRNAAGTFLSSPVGATITPPAGTWTLLAAATGTVPATAARARVFVSQVTGGTLMGIGGTLDASALLYEAAAANGAYFDGDTPASDPLLHLWTGAPHASASIEAATAVSTAAPSLTLPATALITSPSSPPSFATLTAATNYEEAAESQGTVHVVLGRQDKLSNPGPLATRTGTLELWCPTYADAANVRNLLEAGDVALFRQADYPGMDLYLQARAVAIAPDQPTTVRHWLATIAYDEVPRP